MLLCCNDETQFRTDVNRPFFFSLPFCPTSLTLLFPLFDLFERERERSRRVLFYGSGTCFQPRAAVKHPRPGVHDSKRNTRPKRKLPSLAGRREGGVGGRITCLLGNSDPIRRVLLVVIVVISCTHRYVENDDTSARIQDG